MTRLWTFQLQPLSFTLSRSAKEWRFVDGAATVIAVLTGQVRYAWNGPDTASIGTYIGEFEVTYSDEAIDKFPNNGFNSTEINDDLV